MTVSFSAPSRKWPSSSSTHYDRMRTSFWAGACSSSWTHHTFPFPFSYRRSLRTLSKKDKKMEWSDLPLWGRSSPHWTIPCASWGRLITASQLLSCAWLWRQWAPRKTSYQGWGLRSSYSSSSAHLSSHSSGPWSARSVWKSGKSSASALSAYSDSRCSCVSDPGKFIAFLWKRSTILTFAWQTKWTPIHRRQGRM